MTTSASQSPTCQTSAPQSTFIRENMATPSLAEARQFLTAMFDPTQDVERAVAQLSHTIQTSETKATSTGVEFPVATGVKLYRSLRREHGLSNWRACVCVGHCAVERVASSERAATGEAIEGLLAVLREFRRLFGGLLDRVRDECGFPQPLQSVRAYRLATNVAVSQGMNLLGQCVFQRTSGGIVEAWHATAQIDGLDLANGREAARADARARAAHNAMVVLSDLVALREPRLSETSTPETRWSARQLTPDETIARAMAEPPVVGLHRDLSESARDVAAEEHVDKIRVAAYQRLVKALVVSRGTVLQQLQSIAWHDDLQPRTIPFSRHFSVVQRVGKKQNGRYVCELRILEGSRSFSEEGDRLETAVHRLMARIRDWLSQVHRDWSMIADTYAQQKRTKTLNETLSAANEARRCKRFRDVVDESSASRGAMAEYVIRVRGQVAVHRWAVKPKDAKRHASTEFRDLLEWMLATRNGQS